MALMKRVKIYKGGVFQGITEGTEEYVNQWKADHEELRTFYPKRYYTESVLVQEQISEFQDVLDDEGNPTGEQIEVIIQEAVYEDQARENPDGYHFEEEDYTEEHNLKVLRLERDRLLLESDKYMLPDFPITEEQRELMKIYRQALRDAPQTMNLPVKPDFIKD